MSVYIPRDKAGNAKTKFFAFDFRLKPKGATKSQRFFGSTSQKTLRAAERVEQQLRELAKLGQLMHTMNVDEACDKYWEQRMIRVRSAGDQATNLEVISTFLGPETLLVDITPAMISEAAAKRARTPIRRYNRKTKEVVLTGHFPKPSTVNRQLIQPLRRFLKYCRKTLGVPIDLSQFEWGELRYEEAEERNREIQPVEEMRYWKAMREDFQPIVEMYLLSGRRKSDWVMLKRTLVDLSSGTVTMPSHKKKKKADITVKLTDEEIDIIQQEMSKAPDCPYVFTYVVQRGPHKGKRRPITGDGLRRAHKTACEKAGIPDFRIHDYRHTMATKLMRATGNPKLVQTALDHSGLSSTSRYLHVLEKEVVAGRAKVRTYRRGPGLHLHEGSGNAVIPLITNKKDDDEKDSAQA